MTTTDDTTADAYDKGFEYAVYSDIRDCHTEPATVVADCSGDREEWLRGYWDAMRTMAADDDQAKWEQSEEGKRELGYE